AQVGQGAAALRQAHDEAGRRRRAEAKGDEGAKMTGKPAMPLFVFARRRDIEIENGLILAGQLVVDIPKTKKPKRREKQMIAEIVQRLTAEARSGQMPDDAMIAGWPGGRPPANAVDVRNDALMAPWAKDRIIIAVRVDRHGQPRVDSDM